MGIAPAQVCYGFATRFDTADTLTNERTNGRNERPTRLDRSSSVPDAAKAVESEGFDRFVEQLLASPDRIVRLYRERPGYEPPFRNRADRRDRFLELDTAGGTARTIALELHVSTKSVHRWRRQLHRVKREPGPRRPDSDRAHARALLDDGCSLTEVCRTLNIDRHTLRGWFPDEHGWTPAESGAFGRLKERAA